MLPLLVMYMYMYERFHRTSVPCALRVIVKLVQQPHCTVSHAPAGHSRHFYVARRRVRFRPNKTCPDAINSDSRV